MPGDDSWKGSSWRTQTRRGASGLTRVASCSSCPSARPASPPIGRQGGDSSSRRASTPPTWPMPQGPGSADSGPRAGGLPLRRPRPLRGLRRHAPRAARRPPRRRLRGGGLALRATDPLGQALRRTRLHALPGKSRGVRSRGCRGSPPYPRPQALDRAIRVPCGRGVDDVGGASRARCAPGATGR